MNYDLNLVDVNFNFEILNKKNRKLSKYKEIHKMRYFFDPELHEFSNLFKFNLSGERLSAISCRVKYE